MFRTIIVGAALLAEPACAQQGQRHPQVEFPAFWRRSGLRRPARCGYLNAWQRNDVVDVNDAKVGWVGSRTAARRHESAIIDVSARPMATRYVVRAYITMS